jgi:hypothetical protein
MKIRAKFSLVKRVENIFISIQYVPLKMSFRSVSSSSISIFQSTFDKYFIKKPPVQQDKSTIFLSFAGSIFSSSSIKSIIYLGV